MNNQSSSDKLAALALAVLWILSGWGNAVVTLVVASLGLAVSVILYRASIARGGAPGGNCRGCAGYPHCSRDLDTVVWFGAHRCSALRKQEGMQSYLMQMLACPACHGELEWGILQSAGQRVEQAHARCQRCAATFPAVEGIGLLLLPDLAPDDLWQHVDGQLARHLRQHPELARRLMETPEDDLGPADSFYRALVLEERGQYEDARATEEKANQGFYSAEYTACLQSQHDYVIERFSESDGPIVGFASGRRHLVEEMARRLQRPIVAMDVSRRALRQDRRRLESLDLNDRGSLLASDARRTPLGDRAVEALMTNLGLPNIENPGDLLSELRRVVHGQFLAISHLCPRENHVKPRALQEAGLSSLIFQESAVHGVTEARWDVEIVNQRHGRAEPTPHSGVLGGARIDAFPVRDRVLESCVVGAR